LELTLAIIKPDAVKAGHTGLILDAIHQAGLKVAAMKLLHLTKAQAQGFYIVHKERPFYASLTEFMSSGPCVPLVLAGENAIKRWREAMGATNPAQAAEGSIRKRFGANVEQNATHGSDAPETAAFEIAYFFNALEITGR
jgi:nucleoside-diphosphate kinase